MYGMVDPLKQDTSLRAGGIIIPGDPPRGGRTRRPSSPPKQQKRPTPKPAAPPAYKSIDLEQARSENPGIRVTHSDAVAVDEKGRIFPAARMTGKKLSDRLTSPIVILNPADLEDPEKAQAIAEEGLFAHIAGNQSKAGLVSFAARGFNIDGSRTEKDLRANK